MIRAAMNGSTHSRARVLALAGVAALAVFLSDFASPVGFVHAILYVPVVLPTMWSPRRNDPFLVAALCTVLGALGAVLHPGAGGTAWEPELNAAAAAAAIWITAAGVRLRMSTAIELRDSESELDAILQTAIDGVITIDESGIVKSANPAAAAMFGYERSELIGNNVKMLMPSPTRDEHDGYLKRYVDTGKANIIGIGREVVGLRKDRTTVPIDLSISEWRDGSTMFTAILRDLSERRRMEAEIRQAQKLEAIGRLSGGIAHDFNNLLMGILSCGRIAKASEDPAEPRRQIDEILAAAERGAALTRQLLTFSRRKDLSPEPVLVDEVVEQLETMLARLLGEHVELLVELRARHGLVLIDPGQVEQILLNLVINSRDAMGERGRLTVRTSVETCAEAGVGGGGGVGVGRYVRLEVGDDGCGMAEDVRAKAFDPFFTTKPPTEGTGLGLSTVYGLVRQCGGHVHLDTAPGEGTRIALHLPITEAVPTPRLRKAPPKALGSANGRGTILLVEDDRLVRAGVRHILEGLGYEVLLAACGADALRICEEHPGAIDLLLTDILMPGMTGGELAREVSARLPGVRRLYMSALPGEVLIEQGRIEEGAVSVLKPFSADDLAAAVLAALK
jgi:PAS domain S-box-containing protein